MKKTILILFFLFSCLLGAQQDSSKQPIHTQYRRGTILQQGYQTYEQKYQGKDLTEEKRRLYPLDRVTTGTGIWTELNPKVPRVDYLGIHFVNVDTGWVCGDLGTIIKTTDGGQSWAIIQAGDNQALYSVDVIDSLHIAAAGYGGTGYRGKTVYSSDGGNTWLTGGLTTFDPINCIKYINPDTGYFVMSEVGLWKTTNAGQTWAPLDSTGLGNIGEFEIQLFVYENIGYDSGTGLKIFKAAGNLDVWNKLIINDDFVDVFFTSEQTGYALSGALYKTTNGGESFQNLNAPGGYSMTFTDSLTGYIGASNTKLYKTTNAGNSWYLVNIPNLMVTAYWISKFFFINHTTGWAVTLGGGIIKTIDDGENWFAQFDGNYYPSFSSIYFVDSLYGWTADGGNKPFRTTDSGLNWIEQTNIDLYNSTDVYFANRDTGWIANDLPSGLFKTNDGGTNWLIVPEIIGPYNISIFPDHSHWIVSGSQHTYITKDGGNSWNEITNDIPAGFNKFQAPTNFIGYAVGPGGLILKYNDTTYTPIELSSFSANIIGKDVLLNWFTSTETNNRGFEIERKIDGEQYAVGDQWEKIGFVEGNGTTTLTHSYYYTDKNVNTGHYFYRLKQIDFDGNYKYSREVEVNVTTPTEFSLQQNFPNPFNSTTIINFSIPVETNVSLKLYDITGREVKVLVNEKMQPGFYTITLKGGELSSGVYFCRLVTTSGFTGVKKLIILK